MSNFFALLSRMKYIDRWALMRSTRRETLSEHTLEVAMLAHALAVLGNTYLGKSYDPAQCALIALYHDATEIITGDMPTPVKYKNPHLSSAYKAMEAETEKKLLSMLPKELQPAFSPLLSPEKNEALRLVKAADKLSAYIKCIEEEKSGNREFSAARETIKAALDGCGVEEVQLFFSSFMDGYGKTLDALTL
ncbi:MAG: 5'-deoxynucleotidase [Ruminococcaceae bacterium]|nr:5'-deoxynucleotidase [Oscillospiraceae bacterium]